MSYNQTHQMKQFVKAKPLADLKDKSISYQREPKRNNKKYEQKSFQQAKDPREHIKIVLNQFHKVEKDSIIINLCTKFPSLFTLNSSKPEPEIQGSLTDYIMFGGGGSKKQHQQRYIKQLSSDSSDPNWDSDEEKQVKLVSKKIDQNIIQKVSAAKKQQTKKLNELQRHEKQFLQEQYRKKRAQQQNYGQFQQQESDQKKEQKKQDKKQEPKPHKVQEISRKIEEKQAQEGEDWAEYDVGALITEGIIQEVKKGEDDDFEMDDDFSYEDEQSKSSSSSQDDDNMFADEGPRTITKTKEDNQQEATSKPERKQIVQISNHTFTQIAEQIGAHPESCVWIISNKQQRYRVSTLYMNEYYRSLAAAFPYVSLNHSQFVHNDEIQTQKGLEKLKKNDHRRRVPNYNNSNRANARPQPPHYKQKK